MTKYKYENALYDGDELISVTGFKSFDQNGENIALKKMPVGNYHYDGDVKFGKSGYHFCYNMEDTLRYSGAEQGNPKIALVEGSGIINIGFDEYFEYFDMFCVSDLKIIKYLTREEIIRMALLLPEMRLHRFLSLYKLNFDEIKLFYGKSDYIDKVIEYYQLNNKKAFKLHTKQKRK